METPVFTLYQNGLPVELFTTRSQDALSVVLLSSATLNSCCTNRRTEQNSRKWRSTNKHSCGFSFERNSMKENVLISSASFQNGKLSQS